MIVHWKDLLTAMLPAYMIDLVFFLFGLLVCANVMKGFEELLERELELSFFVPLLKLFLSLQNQDI